MNNIEEAMNRAMTDKKYYEKPKQEQEKPNTVSHGVSAITDALDEQKQKIEYNK